MVVKSGCRWQENREREVYGERWTAYGSSRVGRCRANNEDNYVLRQLPGDCLLAAVADGLGGHKAGEVASALACETAYDGGANRWFDESNPDVESIREKLSMLAIDAHEKILAVSGTDPSSDGMASTLTLVLFDGASGTFCHVGDSRLYRVGKSSCEQLTRDHVATQAGETADSASAVGRKGPLTQALGVLIPAEQLHVETGHFRLEPGDSLLLCTDGASDLLDRHEILGEMDPGASPVKQAHNLIEAALLAGAEDDITVVLVRAVVNVPR
jgi:protein phosphatase